MKEIEIAVPLGKPSADAEVRLKAEEMYPSSTCVVTRRSIDARGKAVWRYRVEVYGPD